MYHSGGGFDNGVEEFYVKSLCLPLIRCEPKTPLKNQVLKKKKKMPQSWNQKFPRDQWVMLVGRLN